MEQKRSQSLILSPAEVKARRLKMLQTIEARRLEMVNRQLSRAETKALRQLDFQRNQFRRRLSDVTGHPGSDTLLTDHHFGTSGESSPGDGLRHPPTGFRVTRSLSKVGRSLERPGPLRAPKSSAEKINTDSPQESGAPEAEETRPPFWIRIPSTGIASSFPSTTTTDSDSLKEPPESPGIPPDSGSSSTHSLLPSPTLTTGTEAGYMSPTGTAIEKFTFPTAEHLRDTDQPRTTDMRPMWLKALQKLREQRYARLHGQQAEECEELAALVTGCSLTSTLPANVKRPVPKASTVAR